MMNAGRPERGEAADYYFTYIDKVVTDDIGAYLSTQADAALARLRTVSDPDSLRRYAPDKWSAREVVGHVNDAERVFAFRALWFARGFDTPLPSFDQDVAVAGAGAHGRTWGSHIEEFRAVRAATVALFRDLPADAWTRRGTASGNPVSVRALAYVIAGHLAHHLAILDDRYFNDAALGPDPMRSRPHQ
ncbi:MAG: hypothetical protein JWL71_2821 [Acidobacteria bacterium]|nr:hypothetical protein [Acidobacteriota bacterium]